MSKQGLTQKKPVSNSYSPPAQKAASWQRPFSDPVHDATVSPKQDEAIAPSADLNLMQMKIFPDAPTPVQAKLSVGAPGDKYEREADGMAAKVMAMPAPENEEPIQRQTPPEEKKAEEVQTKPLAAAITPVVQRETTPEEPKEEDSPLQAKTLSTATIQRETTPEEPKEEDSPVQAKALSTATIQRETTPEEPKEEDLPVQAKAESKGKSSNNGNLESQLNGSKGGGSPLPDEVRAFMEPRFGADFSGVRVHTDGAAVQMNKELGAQAFAHGSDIYYGVGKSPGKDELTAHELTHVVQQTGAVQRKCAACEQEEQQRANNENEAESIKNQEQVVQRSLAAVPYQIQRQTTTGDPQCPSLLEQIRRFIFGDQNTKGLIQRWEELRQDPQNLQWDYWTTPHPQYGSVEGHQQQFRNMQQGLRNRLNQWNSKNCDDPDSPSQLPADAWDWATRPAPVPIPRERPAPSSSSSVSVSDVIKVLTILGLSIGLVAVVIAAIADPEPASKLALAGLSAVMITSLLGMLGIEDRSGGSTA